MIRRRRRIRLRPPRHLRQVGQPVSLAQGQLPPHRLPRRPPARPPPPPPPLPAGRPPPGPPRGPPPPPPPPPPAPPAAPPRPRRSASATSNASRARRCRSLYIAASRSQCASSLSPRRLRM